MATKYMVVAVGSPYKSFNSIGVAIRFAATKCYVGGPDRSRCWAALKEGKPFSFVYGFTEVSIAPVEEANP
jgi:hypothetical protein